MGAIADMIRAGVDPDMIERVALEMVAAAASRASVTVPAFVEKRREFDRQRQARRRAADKEARQASTVDASVDRPVDAPSPASPNENNLTPISPTPSEASLPQSAVEKPKRSAGDASEVRGLLETVLSAETAKDYTAHRKALKAPLTIGAAKRIVSEFAKHGDPKLCAETAMARGWRGFEASWMSEQQSFARAGPGRNSGHFQAIQEDYRGGNEHSGSDTREPDIFDAEPPKRLAGKYDGHDEESAGNDPGRVHASRGGYAEPRSSGRNVNALGDLISGIAARRPGVH